MMGFAHDMLLAEIRRQPEHCNFPTPCMMKEDGPCCFDGREGECPLVKAAQRREAEKKGIGHKEDPFLQRIMQKHGLDLRGIN